MAHFLIAIAVFLIWHIVPAYPPLRQSLARSLGERMFLTAYGTLSTVLMVWLFWAYFQAPYVELWPYVPWLRWIPLVAMPVACILVVVGLGSPNPLSVSLIDAGRFDEDRPGIVALTRHPAILGLFLWSLSHIPPNGDLAAVLMFGLLSVLGIYGPFSLNRKRRARLGEAEWRRLTARMAETRPRASDLGWGLVLLGVALYVALLVTHEVLIGVTPYPL